MCARVCVLSVKLNPHDIAMSSYGFQKMNIHIFTIYFVSAPKNYIQPSEKKGQRRDPDVLVVVWIHLHTTHSNINHILK